MAVRQEVNNLESSAVVQEPEFAINRALYGSVSNMRYVWLVFIINIFYRSFYIYRPV